MTQSHSIGKSAEYRLRDWFRDRGWKAERNPLSGASEQIEEELGKHDIRAWRDDLNIFLQIENKKTMVKKKTKDGAEDDTIVIQKVWLDKIDFTNDEFLVFSFNRCKQHFAFMPKEIADITVNKLSLKKTEPFEAKGESGYGFKREWLEGKEDLIFVSNFIGRTWYAFDLGVYIDAREKFSIATVSKNPADRVKAINTVAELQKYKDEESSKWKTKDWKAYYNKLDRLESGETSYNPGFIKESQWWLPEEKRFDWNDNTVKSIMSKVQKFIDTNLEEEDDEIVWAYNKEIDELEKDVRKILGMDKDKKGKDDSKSRKQGN